MFRFTNLVVLEMTRDCNLHCSYCFMLEKHKHRGERIDFDRYCRIVDELVRQKIVCCTSDRSLTFILHGGEATLLGAEYLEKCIGYADSAFRKAGFRYNISIQTNGTLLTDDMLQVFEKYHMSVGVSFDGVGDSNRQRFLSSSRIEYFTDLFERAKQYPHVNMGVLATVTRQTVHSIPETQRMIVDRLGFHSYKMNYVEDMEHPYDSKIEVSARKYFRYVTRPALEHFLECGEIVESGTRDLFEMCLQDIVSYHSNCVRTGCGGRFCGTATGMIGIRPDGSAQVCDRFSREFEELTVTRDVTQMDFLGMHQLGFAVMMAQEKSRVLLENGCDSCRAQYVCSNGCIAFFYSKFGRMGLEKSLICDDQRKAYSWVEKNLVSIVETMARRRVSVDLYWDIYDFRPEVRTYLKSRGLELYVSGERFWSRRTI